MGNSPKSPIANRSYLPRKLRRPASAAKVSRMSDDLLAPDPLWYKDAIIYELHVKTFQDSTGDGMGDFRGLIGKLDYLQDLGRDRDLVAPVLSLPPAR